MDFVKLAQQFMTKGAHAHLYLLAASDMSHKSRDIKGKSCISGSWGQEYHTDLGFSLREEGSVELAAPGTYNSDSRINIMEHMSSTHMLRNL